MKNSDGALASSGEAVRRLHMETNQEIFSGFRRDVLVRDVGEPRVLRIARREINLDHAVLTQTSLGIFF